MLIIVMTEIPSDGKQQLLYPHLWVQPLQISFAISTKNIHYQEGFKEGCYLEGMGQKGKSGEGPLWYNFWLACILPRLYCTHVQYKPAVSSHQ